MSERDSLRRRVPDVSGPDGAEKGTTTRPDSGSSFDAAAEVAIRGMREDDLPQVLRIERASFPTPWSELTFRGLMRRKDSVLLVAEDPEGEVLAHAALWVSGPEAELGDLAVRSDVRRRGVGRALLREAMDAAVRRGARAVFLEVRAGNRPARRLYEAAGFEWVGTRPGYYERPREDALVLRRPLEEPSGSGGGA